MPTNSSPLDSISIPDIARRAVALNVAGVARTMARGRRGWVGGVNTDYDPLDPSTAAQPYEAYRRLHETGRVHYNPRRATWILSRIDDVRDALRATDKVTSAVGVTRFRIAAPLVVLTDGAQHSALRKQIQPAFTRGAMDSWRAMTHKLATELLDELLSDPAGEVMAKLAVPMPMNLIAHVLGVPDVDLDDFRRWSESAVRIMDTSATFEGAKHTAQALAALKSLHTYFHRQFRAGHLKESDTVLGRLLVNETNGLGDNDLFLIAILLLIAGNETTTNLLGGLFDSLASNPDQYDLLRSNPDLVPAAIEEQLRFSSPIQNLYRYTCADYEVAGVTIPTGSRILLSFGAANRDPAAFENPDEYRIDRENKTHVGFGYGAHMCVGAPLARMETQSVLTELVARIERIEHAGPVTWSTNSSLRGPTRLPVKLHLAR
ncbi:cytochrome P450 [Marmoricola sp. OAE513]|uniref:cytochrome P450 n=1 Tax=Marmoricola sp. OAE513 TaxID=2817894 RepID=UPI001AE69278